MALGIVSSSDDVVIKAPTDRRSYRVLHLPNGLTAVLVHDPEIFPDKLPEDFKTLKEEEEEEEEEDDDEEEEHEEEEDEYDEDDDDDVEEGEEGGEGDRERDHGKSKDGSMPTKKAAAAMCVGIGSFSDPFEAQGLAHFLEHMLFMGSSKFPDENELLVQTWWFIKCIHRDRVHLLPF